MQTTPVVFRKRKAVFCCGSLRTSEGVYASLSGSDGRRERLAEQRSWSSSRVAGFASSVNEIVCGDDGEEAEETGEGWREGYREEMWFGRVWGRSRAL